ncbi:hypothetical protein OSB04_004757 [Centaurea solstitialis]|uniref:RING-type domain-containing protein n=1 Tax=Centaurea solstitialis TaxID=347529 RepID=A0AA38WFR6_9ASTR|nr:hypothetical protein OSB04_004757 [Centaurea solstitialis]
MRVLEQDTTPHHPGLYLSTAQRQAVEALIQELPLFTLKAVPTDCSDCPICLEEFHVGDGVRGLPCAHNFHVACIDKWLMLNIKCPRCRCNVFPNLELNDLPNIPPDPDRSSTLSTTHHAQNQPVSQSYLSRMQSFSSRSAQQTQHPLPPDRRHRRRHNHQHHSCTTTNTTATSDSSPSVDNDSDVTLEIVENGGQASESRDPHTSAERVQ